MPQVSAHDERQRPDSDFISVGSAYAVPCFFIQAAKHGDIGQSHQSQLTQEVFELDVIVRRRQHVIVLIKARQILFLATRDAQRAITKDAFAVNEMTDDFADGPFAVGIGGCFFIGSHAAQQHIQFVERMLSDEGWNWFVWGHASGTYGVGTRADAREYAQLISDMVASVRAARAAGLADESPEMLAAVTADLQPTYGSYSNFPNGLTANIRGVLRSLQ